MTALEVECPYCYAVPHEPCRSVRMGAGAKSGRNKYGTQRPRALGRPHAERAAAARSMSTHRKGAS